MSDDSFDAFIGRPRPPDLIDRLLLFGFCLASGPAVVLLLQAIWLTIRG